VTFFQRKTNFVPNHFAKGPYDEKGVLRNYNNLIGKKKIPKYAIVGMMMMLQKWEFKTFSPKINSIFRF
jgi:hypothetical protein